MTAVTRPGSWVEQFHPERRTGTGRRTADVRATPDDIERAITLAAAAIRADMTEADAAIARADVLKAARMLVSR